MKHNSQGRSPMDCAMQYLTARDRTVSEMQTYLDGKNFGEADIDATIERLLALGLLDDRRFAQRFVETRLASKAVSKRHLREQLIGHGLRTTDVEAALTLADAQTEADNALSVARKFARQFAALEPEKRRERVYSRLIARGYSYDDARRAVEQALSEEDACSES